MSVLDITQPEIRLQSLYSIVDKDGESVKFVLNDIQSDFISNLHSRNIVLKCRQVGLSTVSVLYLLDACIWNNNISAGIVSYSLEHAQHIFKRIIGHAIDNLPYWLHVPIVNRSAREIVFGNGSVLRVDTTLRGGAYQYVLVSEFGKTCARNPQKAEEVVTGTLQSVPKNGRIIIESTAEGSDGFFATLVNEAVQHQSEQLTELDYKLFFYPWMSEKTYILENKVNYDTNQADYFAKIEKETGTSVSEKQRHWYVVQQKILGDKITQEYPSFISEAFSSTSEAYYFYSYIERAYKENRCLSTSLYDALLPVYVAMDIGVNDLTVMVFFQLAHGEIRVIDYYEDKDKGVDFYAKFLLQDKPYHYNTIFLPHDSTKRDILDVSNTYERDFKRLFSHTDTRFHVLKRMDKQLQISHAKLMLERCVFNISRVKKFLDKVSKYRKKWNESLAKYVDEPLHDINCFVGETLIETDKGNLRIDQIKIGDKVLTPSGYKTVLNKIISKTNKLVSISDGFSEILCTPHHKIFTNKGLVTADSLRYDDHIITKEEKNLWMTISSHGLEKGLGFKDYFLSMNQKQLLSLMEKVTKKTNLDIGLGIKQAFIVKSGSIIKAKSLKNTIFTILMEINQTIQSKILNLFPILTTCECTCLPKSEKNYPENILEKPLKPQRDGIAVRQGLNGIVSTENTVSIRKNLWKNLAITVVNYIKQFSIIQNIVLQHVNQPLEENQEKITRKGNAKFVSPSLSVIDMKQKKHALRVVEQCLDIEKEVYDLTVENDHCYFANGFLVSNSNYSDCFQYMTQAVTHLESVSNLGSAYEKHRKAIANRANII